MDRNDIDALAWDVVENLRRHLTVDELNAVFVKLGVGEPESAIEAVLRQLAAKGAAVPDDLRIRLRHWVCRYEGNPLHAQLRALLQYVEHGPNPSA